MTRIICTVDGVFVEYLDGAITCTRNGEAAGEYTMGATMIVGSTELSADLRRRIHAEIQRGLA
jgi:hypothetical protein